MNKKIYDLFSAN